MWLLHWVINIYWYQQDCWKILIDKDCQMNYKRINNHQNSLKIFKLSQSQLNKWLTVFSSTAQYHIEFKYHTTVKSTQIHQIKFHYNKCNINVYEWIWRNPLFIQMRFNVWTISWSGQKTLLPDKYQHSNCCVLSNRFNWNQLLIGTSVLYLTLWGHFNHRLSLVTAFSEMHFGFTKCVNGNKRMFMSPASLFLVHAEFFSINN